MDQVEGWIAGHYGSRRGFASAYWHRALYLAGSYRNYQQIDWDLIERLVFVCKGNICRSAYAESVARSLGVDAVSCGIETRNGFPANETAIKTAAAKGIDLSQHRTTAIQSMAFKPTDLFIAMEPWQVERIAQEIGKDCKCSLLGLWGVPASPHIQDPYGASTTYFKNCFNYIEESVNEIARKIKAAGSY